MTLARFMDASYALLVEEHQRIDPLKDFLTVGEKILPDSVPSERAPAKAEVKARNEQSMAALQGMLKQIPNSPLKRKPRRA